MNISERSKGSTNGYKPNRPRLGTGSVTPPPIPALDGSQGPAPPVPTSTSKALLMTIAVPKVYKVYIPPKDQPDASKDAKQKNQLRMTRNQRLKDAEAPLKDPSFVQRDTDKKISTSSLGKVSVSSSVRTMQRTETPMNPDDQSLKLVQVPSQVHIDKSQMEPLDSLQPSSLDTTDRGGNIRSTTPPPQALPKRTEPIQDLDLLTDLKEVEVPVRVVQLDRSTNDSMREHEVGYVEKDEHETAGDRQASIVEHIITKEEMSMIVKIDPVVPKEKGPPSQDGSTDESDPVSKPGHKRVQTDSSLMEAATDAIKSFFGVINKNSTDLSTAYMSREEAVAAIKHYESPFKSANVLPEITETDTEGETENDDAPKPNTEIKLGELLRLTIRNLYREQHFYNSPIYADVQSQLILQETTEEWMELTVMVKPSSIGIILERLERIGVGSSVGTISIYKAELLRTCDILPEVKEEAAKADGQKSVSTEAQAAEKARLDAARAEWKNAASRLRVEQVKEQIEEQASLSFDYLSLLAIASILAGIGLITDNAVVIVASMLVSPIMGPVMGMTFGSQVADWNLALKSVWHEFVSLLVAVLIGVIIGICTSFCPTADTWPTEQMSSRGSAVGLVTGIAIAIPSGMGVALSLLGNNTSSLVGVAISASLLPPAVNAGICWVFAILLRTGAVEVDISKEDENFNFIAGVSFALTMLNIVCIWVSGILMFELKEVAPLKSKSAFWSRDIKVARAIQKGSRDVDLNIIKAGLQDVIKKERDGKGQPQHVPDRKPLVRGSQMSLSFNMNVNPVDDGDAFINIEEYIGPSDLPAEEKFYRLGDMTKLFGLDQSENVYSS